MPLSPPFKSTCFVLSADQSLPLSPPFKSACFVFPDQSWPVQQPFKLHVESLQINHCHCCTLLKVHVLCRLQSNHCHCNPPFKTTCFVFADCRYIFNNSLITTASHGIFHTPNYPKKYPEGKRCLFIFVGKADERVEMKFATFNIQGVAPL